MIDYTMYLGKKPPIKCNIFQEKMLKTVAKWKRMGIKKYLVKLRIRCVILIVSEPKEGRLGRGWKINGW